MPETITDKLTKRVEIQLDGKTWPLVMGTNELIECERLTGLNLLTGEVNIAKPSLLFLRAALYVCLRRAGATHANGNGKPVPYTIEEIGALITPANLEAVGVGVIQAYMASMPEPEPEGDGDRPTEEAA